jgi:hypothetical protein
MTRITFLLPSLVLLAPTSPVLAGPPEGPSGQMVLDEVTEALLKLRREPDPEKQRAMIRRLGPVRDARVTVALMELALDDNSPLRPLGASMLAHHHIPRPYNQLPTKVWTIARLWWDENESEVRRRAKQLP